MIKYNKKHISYICDNPLISIFNLYKWKEVLQYLNNGNEFIDDKMKKAKKREEKLKKTRNRINPLIQKDFEDNYISILFSTFNILKSNKMEEKDPNINSQNKNENDQKYKDSLFSIYINNSKNENEDKKKKKKMKKRSKMSKKMK